MNLTSEQLAKAKNAKSAEELLALAKETGVELTGEEAKRYFDALNRQGEFTDDELDAVVGAKGEPAEYPAPKYHVNECYWFKNEDTWGTIVSVRWDDRNWKWEYKVALAQKIRFGMDVVHPSSSASVMTYGEDEIANKIS